MINNIKLNEKNKNMKIANIICLTDNYNKINDNIRLILDNNSVFHIHNKIKLTSNTNNSGLSINSMFPNNYNKINNKSKKLSLSNQAQNNLSSINNNQLGVLL